MAAAFPAPADRSIGGDSRRDSAIRGELKGRIAQFTMMAVYPDHWSVLQRVVPLLAHPYRR